MDQDKTASDFDPLKESIPSNGVFGIGGEDERKVASRVKTTISNLQDIRRTFHDIADMSRTFWVKEPGDGAGRFAADSLQVLVYDIHELTGINPVEASCHLLVCFRRELRKDKVEMDHSHFRPDIWLKSAVLRNSTLKLNHVISAGQLYQASTLYSALMQMRFV